MKFKNSSKTISLRYGGSLRLSCQYEGQMIGDKIYGKGTVQIGKECTIKCDTWINGKLNGIVVETFVDGDVVIREYKDGKMHGKATLYWNQMRPNNYVFNEGRII